MSTSITAGGGKVSGTTSGPGGTVTHSGGSGSFSTSSASDGKSTVVTEFGRQLHRLSQNGVAK